MAQERKKTRIVLASILKPVDDTRMFEKMGITLARERSNEVSIIGYPSTAVPSFTSIQFIPLALFPRLSFGRIWTKWRVFKIALTLRPSVFIFNTHELIFPAIWLKVIFGTKIVYDVQENHYRNILHSGSFPLLVRIPLALGVRLKEKLFAPSIDHFFLAEKSYESEFRFHRGGWTVVQNKALSIATLERNTFKKVNVKISLLFSGTLAASTGVYRAIDIAKELHRLDSSVQLKIIGYAALEEVREQLRHAVGQCDYIDLVGIDHLVPHSEILDAIQHADFGIISYLPSDHTNNSHPTKLFEYLDAQLPIILDQDWPWVKRYEEYKPFVFLDFAHPDYPGLLAGLKAGRFYSKAPENVGWASEEKKLLDALSKL